MTSPRSNAETFRKSRYRRIRASLPLYRPRSCFRVWGYGEGLGRDKLSILGEANITRASGARTRLTQCLVFLYSTPIRNR